jgi:rubrerythrin
MGSRSLLALLLLSSTPALAAVAATETTRNLQRAHAHDVAAAATYAAYAERAANEGHRQVAKLFRAAARSEEVRARAYAALLRRGGVEPTSAETTPTVNTTHRNLMRIVADENAERASTYPRYAGQARLDGHPEAVLAFTLAHAVESELVKLYQDALSGLGTSRDPGEAFHVCETCGHVARKSAPDRCPVCLSGQAAYASVS